MAKFVRLLLLIAIVVLVSTPFNDAMPVTAAAPPFVDPLNSDLDIVRSRFLKSLLPTQPDEAIRTAKKLCSALLPNATWGDIDYADQQRAGWKTANHLSRVQDIAGVVALGTEEPSIVQCFHDSFDFWLDKDFTNPNWWWNDIGVPQTMSYLMLLAGSNGNLTSTELDRAQTMILRSECLTGSWTGANLVWMCRIRAMDAVMTGNTTMCKESFDRIFEEIAVEHQSGDNIQVDASFHQHGPELLAGSYGDQFTGDLLTIAAQTANTSFAVPEDKITILSGFILDGQRWMLVNGTWDWSVTGRQTTRSPCVYHAGWDTPAIRAIAPGAGIRASELLAFADNLDGLTDESVRGNRMYWDSDYMAHKRKGWSASVHMVSDRTTAAKCVNEEGKLSEHFADGTLNVYTSPHGVQSWANVFPSLDWSRLPGTTADSSQLRSCDYAQYETGQKFVGGTTDGMYGMAAMSLKSRNSTAQKAYFFIDDAVVCVGSRLTLATTLVSQYTTLDARVLHGDVTVGYVGSTTTKVLGGGNFTLDADNAWIWNEGDQLGYVVLDSGNEKGHTGTSLHVNTANRTGNWTDINTRSGIITMPVFEVYLETAGSSPETGNYAYIVCTGSTDVASMQKYANGNHGVALLSNNGNVTVVAAADALIVGATMWIADSVAELGDIGSFGNLWVTSDQPCVLLFRATAPSTSSSLSPTLAVYASTPGYSGDLYITISNSTNVVTTLHLDMPLGDFQGQPVEKFIFNN